MPAEHPQPELHALLAALFNETIEPIEHARLEQLLSAGPEAMDTYFAYVDVHRGLRRLHAELGLMDSALLASCGESVGSDCQANPAERASPTKRPLFDRSGAAKQCGPVGDSSSDRQAEPAVAEFGSTRAKSGIDGASRRNASWRRRYTSGLGAALLVALVVVAWIWNRPRVELVRGVGHELKELVLSQGQKSGSGSRELGNGPRHFPHLQGEGDVVEIPLSRKDLVGRCFALQSGLVELSFHKASASVVIEAPARFRVEDAQTLHIEYGRVAAHVRDGMQGLRVLTPDMDVLDLGTRFAVDVIEGRRSEVHVLEGKVRAGSANSDERQELTANQSLRFDRAAGPKSCDVRNGTFVQPEEIVPLSAALTAGQAGHAARAAELLKRDPALLAFVDFRPTQGTEPVEPVPEIVGARPVQGRFPGRIAVEFVGRTDHVKLNLGVRTRQVTLMTWVRLNQTMGTNNSLYSADGWDTRGQVHWMINHNHISQMDGLMRFAINGAPIEDERRRGESRWAVARTSLSGEFGRWVHLAVVYDAEEQLARLYINGFCDSEAHIPESIPAMLGPAQIGNWKPDGNQQFRRLSGRMDEFVALSRVLGADEIHAYFQETTPYR